MTTQKPELMPCPFCGSEASFGWESDAAAIGRTKRRVFCGFCGIRTVEYEDDSIHRWNTRASTDLYTAVVAERDALRELCEGMAGALGAFLEECQFRGMPPTGKTITTAEDALTAYENHKGEE